MKEMITQNPLAVLALVGFVGAMLMMMLNVNGDAAATLTPPDLTGLQGEMEQCLKDMEGLQGKAEEADKAGDKEKAKQARSMYDDLVKKFDGLKGKAAAAKDQIGRIELLNELRGLNAVDTPRMPTGRPAEPADHDLRGKAHTDAFLAYLRGEASTLSGEKAALLEADSPALRDKGALMPRSWIGTVLRGKATTGTMLSTDTSPAKLIPEDYQSVLQMLAFEPAMLYERCTRMPATTGALKWPKLTQTDADEYGGVSVSRTTEGDEYHDTDADFGTTTINAYELTAQTAVHRTLLRRSAIDLEALIPMLFQGAMRHTVEKEIMTGRGASQKECLGIKNDTNVREWARTTANTVTYEDLVTMKHAIQAHHRRNLMWVIADDAMEKLVKTKDSDGRPIYSDGVANGAFDQLLGIPVYSTERLNVGTEGDVMLGNWGQYFIALEEEIVIMRSEHRHIEKGLILFVATMNIGGRAMQPRAFVRLGNENNLS
jgi:HK97 family phage major capsid protein